MKQRSRRNQARHHPLKWLLLYSRHALASSSAPLGAAGKETDMRFLYLVTKGGDDPTLASVPLHLAVNGSAEVGHDTQVLLAGDAVEIVIASKAEAIRGLGLPPMSELLSKLKEHQIPVYV
jgi:hypothetical protein